MQAGVSWTDLHNWLPSIQEPLRRARELRRLVETSSPGHGLWDVPLNEHSVRTGNPIDELTDRIARLRHGSWALSEHPDHAIATLRDLAGLGVAVHAHAAMLYGIDLTDRESRTAGIESASVDASPSLTSNSWILAGGRAWQHVGADLQRYLATAAPDPGIREDVIEVRQKLNELIPLGRPIRIPGINDPVTRRCAALVNGAVSSMARVAEWNAHTFSALVSSRAVHVRLSDLTGDEITDNPDLVATKLHTPASAPMPAPKATADHTIAAYSVVQDSAQRRVSASNVPARVVESFAAIGREPTR